jgi:hypothetical protein
VAARAARPRGLSHPGAMEQSLGRRDAARNGTITTGRGPPGAAPGLPGVQVGMTLRDHELVVLPHVAVPLERVCDDGTAPARQRLASRGRAGPGAAAPPPVPATHRRAGRGNLAQRGPGGPRRLPEV